jgi:hypothetical protein
MPLPSSVLNFFFQSFLLFLDYLVKNGSVLGKFLVFFYFELRGFASLRDGQI